MFNKGEISISNMYNISCILNLTTEKSTSLFLGVYGTNYSNTPLSAIFLLLED